MVTQTITQMRIARHSRALSQQQVAKAAAVGISDYSKIECGRLIPGPGQAQRIADVLGLAPGELQKPVELEAVAS